MKRSVGYTVQQLVEFVRMVSGSGGRVQFLLHALWISRDFRGGKKAKRIETERWSSLVNLPDGKKNDDVLSASSRYMPLFRLFIRTLFRVQQVLEYSMMLLITLGPNMQAQKIQIYYGPRTLFG